MDPSLPFEYQFCSQRLVCRQCMWAVRRTPDTVLIVALHRKSQCHYCVCVKLLHVIQLFTMGCELSFYVLNYFDISRSQ